MCFQCLAESRAVNNTCLNNDILDCSSKTRDLPHQSLLSVCQGLLSSSNPCLQQQIARWHYLTETTTPQPAVGCGSHPSTNRARLCLTSLIVGKWRFPVGYGRCPIIFKKNGWINAVALRELYSIAEVSTKTRDLPRITRVYSPFVRDCCPAATLACNSK